MYIPEYNNNESLLKLVNRIKYLEEKVEQLDNKLKDRLGQFFRVDDTVKNSETGEIGTVIRVYDTCAEVLVTSSETWNLDEIELVDK